MPTLYCTYRRYDFVDLSRQLLESIGRDMYTEMTVAFRNRSIANFEKSTQVFLALLDELEELLNADEHFLLGAVTKRTSHKAGRNTSSV